MCQSGLAGACYAPDIDAEHFEVYVSGQLDFPVPVESIKVLFLSLKFNIRFIVDKQYVCSIFSAKCQCVKRHWTCIRQFHLII